MSTQKRRDGCYYSRLRVPTDLQRHLDKHEVVKHEVVKSLATSSYRKANLLAKSWEAHVADLFIHLRQNGATMTKQQIDDLVTRYVTYTVCDCLAIWCRGEDLNHHVTLSFVERHEMSLSGMIIQQ